MMGKWYGEVGYAESYETTPGVWTDKIVVRHYYGDVLSNTSRWANNPDSTNDNLTLSSRISIVADRFAYQQFHTMKWVEYMGTKWKVSSVDPQPPRLILSLGGVYNGE